VNGRVRVIGLALLLTALVAGAAFAWWRSFARSATSGDFPEGIRMVCTSDACGRGFTTTVAEIARVREADEEAPVPCPDCGGPSEPAHVCPSCGGSFPSAMLRGPRPLKECPLCREPLPKATSPG
jgi:hypothetical protein